MGGKRIATLERTGFAIHGVAFGTDRLCMSEAGGGNPFRSDNARPLLRCLDTQSGAELWRYTPPLGWNIPCLSYAQKAMAFFGIEKPYMKGGKKRLLRFNPDSGKSTRVAGIERPCATEFFCSCGESLLTSEGELIDVVRAQRRKRSVSRQTKTLPERWGSAHARPTPVADASISRLKPKAESSGATASGGVIQLPAIPQAWPASTAARNHEDLATFAPCEKTCNKKVASYIRRVIMQPVGSV